MEKVAAKIDWLPHATTFSKYFLAYWYKNTTPVNTQKKVF
jgi:hypothetical protein